MYLRQLEIIGFKSFAQKTELNFPHGVAAVVGPNGCGKSNVLDAIRWALGEQSAKALRGGEMADVIFSGTDSRAAVSVAEVSMTFSECEAELGTDYHEVRITRRVYRDGKGEYLLNKTACRLRDIQELFMDTGIGRSAYSIMEQGKIDLILSSRPEDRRAIFEEAAGITKYKSQRREASRKLESTEANLLRLTDILTEVKRQLNTLQRQAAKARRHQSLGADLRLLDTHLSHDQFGRLQRELNAVGEELSRLRVSQTLAERHVSEGEEKLTVQRAALEGLAARLLEARDIAQEWRDKLRQSENRLEFNRERATESQGLLERYEADLTGAREKLHVQEEQLQAADEEQRQIAALLEANQKRLSEQEALVREARARRAEAERASQNAQRAAAETETKLGGLRAELARMIQQQHSGEARRELLASEVTRIDPLRAEAAARVAETRAQLAAASVALESRRAEQRKAEETLLAAQRALSGAETFLSNAQRQQAGRTARLEALRQLNESGAGLAAGTQAVLKGLNQPELFKPAMAGMLGAQMEVEPRYIPAVEAALGQNLQAILLRDEEVAEVLLKTLAEGKKVGRTALAIPQTSPDTRGEKPSLPDGAIIWALDAFKATKTAAPLLEKLLRDTLIVENLDAAHAIRRVSPGLTLATLGGELLGRDGLWQGGQGGDAGQGVLQRQTQIRALEGEIAAGAEEITASTRRRDDAAAALQEANAALNDARQALQSAQVQASTLQNALGLLERESRDLTAKADSLRREHEDTERRSQAAREQVGALETRLQEQVAALEGQQQERIDAAEKTESLRAQEEALNEAYNESRVQVVTEQQRHESLRRQRQPMDARRVELAELIERRRRELEEHHRRIEQFQNDASKLEFDIENARFGLNASEEQIRVRHAEHEQAANAIEEIDAALRRQRQDLTGWHERRSHQEVREAQARLRLDNLLEQTNRRYQVDLRQFSPDLPALRRLYETLIGKEGAPLDWAQVETLTNTLREKLEGIGAVNVDAIAEFDALDERHRFLETQNTDLLAAKTDLLNIIARINTTTRTLFAETFERIRVNFQEMFGELFGGGRANLLLVNEEDPLECGIDIIARPPGKQLQSISLLSGGEKTMTAVALLFSIYMVKPSPFCVLDEMDAPLDESNIARFLKILDRFVGQSQFIVITHNKRTIARADVLYGVTMEEAGVSKLVAVRMAKREESPAPTPNGAAQPPTVAETFGKSEKLRSETGGPVPADQSPGGRFAL
jgi:chromosome segregation protein